MYRSSQNTNEIVVWQPRSLLRNFAVAWYKIGFLVCFPPSEGILETEEPSITPDVVLPPQKCRISDSCKNLYHAYDKKYLRMPRGASLISLLTLAILTIEGVDDRTSLSFL